MKEIITIDCETDPFEHGKVDIKPFVWGVFDGKCFDVYETGSEVVEALRERDAYVFAHNGGKFDFHFLCEHIPDFAPLRIINGRVASFKIGKATYRDSYLLFPESLSKWQKDEFDYALMHADRRREYMREITEYLENDCRFLHDFVSQFVASNGMSLTLPSAAYKIWKEKFSGGRESKTTKGFYDQLSPFYYGGRVEVFRSGSFDGNFRFVDINSAYPAAMRDSHPWGDAIDITCSVPRKDISLGFVELEAASRGFFPFRDEKGGVDYPNDGETRTFHVTGHEYLAARSIDKSYEMKVSRFVSLGDSIDFKLYVEHFVRQKTVAKLTGDKYGYAEAKLFLNSLYGKFAANPDRYRDNEIIPSEFLGAASDDGWEFAGFFGTRSLVERELNDKAKRFFNLATAASITGSVRAKMMVSLDKVTSPIYCDTDSILCRDTGCLDIDPTRLGAWDVEMRPTEVHVAGKKLYALREGSVWKTASKGARLSPAEIKKVTRGDTVLWESLAPTFSVKRGTSLMQRNIRKTVA